MTTGKRIHEIVEVAAPGDIASRAFDLFILTLIAPKVAAFVAETAHERTILQRQIDATDRQVDRLVYELYDLTDEDIRIVEESTK